MGLLYTENEWKLITIRQFFYNAGRYGGKHNERLPEDLIVGMALRLVPEKSRIVKKATATAKEAYEEGWKEGSKIRENLNLISAQ